MLLGIGSLVLALVEPQRSGLPSGFIVSTIGITAIVVGVHAVRVARWGSATTRAFGRGGAILGTVGTALMLYALLAFGLTTIGIALPALSLPAVGHQQAAPAVAMPTSDAADGQPTAATTSPGSAVGAPAAPAGGVESGATTRATEQSSLTQSAGTLAFVMEQRFGAGPYPSTLAVGGSAPERIMLADGSGLAAVPDGARVLYSAATDGSAWSVTIIGAQFGSVVTYSSAIGTVTAG
ncbi:hypothetical protein SAMN02800687_3640 [Curtobacterium sp. UNCCL20]|uniref:hypothetical protein n=1 Tax=Curtobacterium sp. UNCCL20 TaxID=1502773 RepID=UPI0008896DD1|nr:hypothetical protein [Curtobacterium sp. UNCCL20]SDR08127.1 hypothetical protein SAMN02800687_3640 [Curtobacterium sp. UNCCL20]